jgi:hypothetical protein
MLQKRKFDMNILRTALIIASISAPTAVFAGEYDWSWDPEATVIAGQYDWSWQADDATSANQVADSAQKIINTKQTSQSLHDLK